MTHGFSHQCPHKMQHLSFAAAVLLALWSKQDTATLIFLGTAACRRRVDALQSW